MMATTSTSILKSEHELYFREYGIVLLVEQVPPQLTCTLRMIYSTILPGSLGHGPRLECGPGGLGVEGEGLSVHLVHSGEVAQVSQQHLNANDIAEIETSLLWLDCYLNSTS